jgi:hypothetical protein
LKCGLKKFTKCIVARLVDGIEQAKEAVAFGTMYEEDDAAAKIQAVQRGKNARKQAGAGATETEVMEVAGESAPAAAAAAGEDDAEQNAAATKIQAVQRGKNSRRDPPA